MIDDIVMALSEGLWDVGVPSCMEVGGGDWGALHVDLIGDFSVTICVFGGRFWFAFHCGGLRYRVGRRTLCHNGCLRRVDFELCEPGSFERVVRLTLAEIKGETLLVGEGESNAGWSLERRLERLRGGGRFCFGGPFVLGKPYYLV